MRFFESDQKVFLFFGSYVVFCKKRGVYEADFVNALSGNWFS